MMALGRLRVHTSIPNRSLSRSSKLLCRVLAKEKLNRGSLISVKSSKLAQGAVNVSPVWSSHVSRNPDLDMAVHEAVDYALAAATVSHFHEESSGGTLATIDSQLRSPLPEPDLAIVFCSSSFSDDYDRILGLIRRQQPSLKTIIGCTGFGVIGGAQSSAEEVEDLPAMSITLARLPQTDVKVAHVSMADLPDADAAPELWADLMGLPRPSLMSTEPLSFVILADPSFIRFQELLAGLDYAFPTASKIGGLSSSNSTSPDRALFCWDADAEAEGKSAAEQGGVSTTGAVVMALHGGVAMDLIVAQGCRPLSGTTWTVERIDRATNRILSIREEVKAGDSGPGRGGQRGEITPFEALQSELQNVAQREQELRGILQNLMLGMAPDSLSLQPHDFLIRPMAVDNQGSLAVGEYVRVGQRIRFMLRDQQGAKEDLQAHGMAFKRQQLERGLLGSAGQPQKKQALGMMLFSCNGRGSGLYNEPSYDTRTLSSFIPVPCCGFLCNGEIGSVRGATHLHGFTCVVGVLRTAELGAAAEDKTPEADETSRRESGPMASENDT